MYRRATKRYISKIKNINIIQQKLKQALIIKKDVFQEITLKVYQIGYDNSYTDKVVFKGNISDTIDWCSEKQIEMKSVFDGYLNNIRNNSDRTSLLKFTKSLLDKINESNLYSDKCFKMVRKFIRDFSIKDPQLKLKDSMMKSYIDGDKGIKEEIAFYRKIVTNDRVNILNSLNNYYIQNDKKENYTIGVNGIKKAIDNNQILTIELIKNGTVRIRPKQIHVQKWILLGQQLDDENNVISNVVICQSDVKK